VEDNVIESGTQAYLTQEVDNADPARLVELLYQRALRDLNNSRDQWENLSRSPTAIHLAIHAQTIIQELNNSLNYKTGGDLAMNLGRLYEYMQYTLVEALNTRQAQDVAKITEVIELLEPLSDAWTTMSQETNSGQGEGVFAEGNNLVA
jgi:flagellar protein FliS